METGTPTHEGNPLTGPQISPNDWRVLLLKRIGAPVTWNNLNTLQAWAMSESGYNPGYGTNLADPHYYNPLAITDSYGVPHLGSINSDGVLTFASKQFGVEATAAFLEHGYGDVIQGFKDNNAQEVYDAVNNSGWCRGCQSGQYPIGLATWLQGGKVSGIHQSFTGSGEGSGGYYTKNNPTTSSNNVAGTGGLYNACPSFSTSSSFLFVSLPTGVNTSAIGCYLSQTLKFGIGILGGGTIMLAGVYFLLREVGMAPGLASGIGKLGPVGYATTMIASKVPGSQTHESRRRFETRTELSRQSEAGRTRREEQRKVERIEHNRQQELRIAQVDSRLETQKKAEKRKSREAKVTKKNAKTLRASRKGAEARAKDLHGETMKDIPLARMERAAEGARRQRRHTQALTSAKAREERAAGTFSRSGQTHIERLNQERAKTRIMRSKAREQINKEKRSK